MRSKEGLIPATTVGLDPNDVLWRRKKAAVYLSVEESTLALWASKGTPYLPYTKMGRLAMYRKADLDEFISRRTRGVEPVAAIRPPCQGADETGSEKLGQR